MTAVMPMLVVAAAPVPSMMMAASPVPSMMVAAPPVELVSVTVATPALDLSLTDAAGQVVLRKTLMPADFGAAAPVALAAGADVSLNAVLDVGPLRVVGYTVLAYYP